MNLVWVVRYFLAGVAVGRDMPVQLGGEFDRFAVVESPGVVCSGSLALVCLLFPHIDMPVLMLSFRWRGWGLY